MFFRSIFMTCRRFTASLTVTAGLVCLLASTPAARAGMAEDMLDAASFSLTQGNLNKAKEQLERGLKADPANAAIVSLLMQIAVAEGDVNGAAQQLTTFEKTLKKGSLPPALATQKAALLQHQGKNDEALAVYNTILAENPQHVEALVGSASLLATKNDFQQAYNRLEQATQLAPQNAQAFYNKGIVLGAAGQLELGIDSLRKAIQLNPGMVPAYSALAQLYRQLADALDAQVTQFQQAQQAGGQQP